MCVLWQHGNMAQVLLLQQQLERAQLWQCPMPRTFLAAATAQTHCGTVWRCVCESVCDLVLTQPPCIYVQSAVF